MKNKTNHLFIFIIYLEISLFFTYPLLLHMGNYLIGKPLDGYLYLWNVDNFWNQIFHWQNPFYTYNIFFPIGANLALNTSAPLVSVFGLPFLKAIPFYINFLILLSFPASAIFVFKLIEKITKNKSAGFISGLFYGFSPIIFSYIISQHYYFAFAAVFIPIGVYFCEEFASNLNPWNLAKVALFFWVIFFIDYYTAVLYLIICLIYTLIRLLFLKNFQNLSFKKILDYLKIALLTFFVPLLTFYVLVFSKTNMKAFYPGVNYYPKICSAHLADFVTPSDLNPVLKQFSPVVRSAIGFPKSGDTPYLYLGFLPILIVLSVLFLKRIYPTTLPFFGTGLVVLVLSMGPYTPVYDYFAKLPFMSFVDCPQRFTVGIQLALASLIGILFSQIKLKNKNIQKLILPVFILIFLIEYGTFGLPLTKLVVPEIYQNIARDQNNLTVLELPSGLTESKGAFGYDWTYWGLNSMQMYWQTIYHKPKVGGYVSRIDKNTYSFFENEPIISDLFSYISSSEEWPGKTFSDSQVDRLISKFNLGYIILAPNPRQQELEKSIDSIFRNWVTQKIKLDEFILYKLKTVY